MGILLTIRHLFCFSDSWLQFGSFESIDIDVDENPCLDFFLNMVKWIAQRNCPESLRA